MKTFLYLAILPVLFLISCNKSHDSGSSSYITCTLDGVSKNFAGGVTASRTADVTGVTLNINGLFSQTATDGMDLLIGYPNPSASIDPGTYVDTVATYRILLTYLPSPTAMGYSAGSSTSDSAAHNSIAITNHLKVVISSLSSVEVKGSFTGDIFLNGNATADKRTVMNGSFDVKF